MYMKFNEVIQGEKPVLVDFTAEWCGPCKIMSPILKELKGIVKEKLTILKIDIDKNPAAARTYQVQSVPTLIVFQKGKIIWRSSGVIPINQLQQVIQPLIQVNA